MQFFNTAVPDGSITTAKLANLAVTAAKIAAGAVTNDKLAGPRANLVVVSASGIYTPSGNITGALVMAIGGGGAGGGAQATGAGQVAGGSGGNSGGWGLSLLTSSQIGASQVVTIGAGGVGASGADGGTGGDTTFGALVKGGRGYGGTNQGPTATLCVGAPLPDFVEGIGTITYRGSWGTLVVGYGGQGIYGGSGGNSPFGAGGFSVANSNGEAGSGYGAGGGGAASIASMPARPGGDGSSGVVIIIELW